MQWATLVGSCAMFGLEKWLVVLPFLVKLQYGCAYCFHDILPGCCSNYFSGKDCLEISNFGSLLFVISFWVDMDNSRRYSVDNFVLFDSS